MEKHTGRGQREAATLGKALSPPPLPQAATPRVPPDPVTPWGTDPQPEPESAPPVGSNPSPEWSPISRTASRCRVHGPIQGRCSQIPKQGVQGNVQSRDVHGAAWNSCFAPQQSPGMPALRSTSECVAAAEIRTRKPLPCPVPAGTLPLCHSQSLLGSPEHPLSTETDSGPGLVAQEQGGLWTSAGEGPHPSSY